MKINLNFAKVLEDGNLEYAPVPLVVDGVNFWTNITEAYTAAGYYPVETTASPLGNDSYYYTSHYELLDGKAVQVWDEHEIPVVEPEPVDESDPEAQLAELEALLDG